MSRIKKSLLALMFIGFLIGSGYLIYLDFQIRTQFEGKRWSVPAYVFARPLELYPGKEIRRTEIIYELNRLNYKLNDSLSRPGTYHFVDSGGSGSISIYTRRFRHPEKEDKPQRARVNIKNGIVVDIQSLRSGQDIPILRLDPVVVAKIYPSHKEDRILVQLKDVPEKFIKALKAVEDRNFDRHIGISFKGMLRAAWANFKAGRRVQGGSTLTQQLVKNYFLTRNKSLLRKLNEIPMAMLLELHYKKSEILEAYMNEVWLGQDGNRAIHGFGLASQFYFAKPLADLETHEIALLVGMVKGAHAYNPRRKHAVAMRRRNVVLDVMRRAGIISEEEALVAKDRGLDVVSKKQVGIRSYPAFVDLLRKQLRRDYREEDLTSGGLRIITTLDPIIQYYAESSLKKQIEALEKWKDIKPGKLQGAVIVTRRENGEVLAIVGGRNPRFWGFNRAINAKRQIGSLIKPAVYLSALESGKTLSSMLDDTEFSYSGGGGKVWAPLNYDKDYHGHIPLFYSLAHSYNVSTARLGLEIGLDNVIGLIRRLGIKKSIRPYPSLLLGAINLAPIEVAQMYQTFANNGFNTNLQSIKAVMNSKGESLQSYPLKMKKVVDSGLVFQLNTALQVAVATGTGRGLSQFIPKDYGIAGKTGTTDNTVDSWFSAFSGKYLGVVWVGRDDHKPTGLTGSVGALKVWGELFSKIKPGPLKLEPPSDTVKKFEYYWIDPKTGLVTSKHCRGAILLPYQEGRAPREQSSCTSGGMRWLDFLN